MSEPAFKLNEEVFLPHHCVGGSQWGRVVGTSEVWEGAYLYDVQFPSGAVVHSVNDSQMSRIRRLPAITQSAVTILNEALAADPVAITALVNHRVPCSNLRLLEHPSIQLIDGPTIGDLTIPAVGLLGILNGILEPITGQRVAAQYDEDDRVVGFQVYRSEETQEKHNEQ